MFENLIDLIRGNADNAVIRNPSIPNEKNEAAVKTAGNSIMTTLRNALSGGNLSEVFSFFKNGRQGSPQLVQEATNNYAKDLQNDLGIEPVAANKAAADLIPNTMQQLADKTADPSEKRFDVQDIFNKLSGNKTSGLNIQEMLKKFGGGKLDKDRDGDVDLQDLKAMFSGAGGIGEKVKGMFS